MAMALATRQDTAPTDDDLQQLCRDLLLLITRPWFREHYRPLIRYAVAVLRRPALPLEPEPDPECYDAGGLRLNVQRHEVAIDGLTIRLARSESALMGFLMRVSGRTVSRREIVERGWGQVWLGTEGNRVDVCVRRLRQKLDAAHPLRFIGTVRSVGYYLAVDDEGEG